jgi:polyisoprenoid-binding protein YceI
MAKWLLATAHSSALFAARHMMVTWVRGFFTEVSGTLMFDPLNVAAATLTVEIAAASLYTGVAQRDNHLKSADFLDVANYPAITFASTGVEQVALDQAWVKGDLTIRGITRSVLLDARWSGPAQFDDEGTVYTSFGFRGTTMINREDFGMAWNTPMEHGGVMVGRHIYISVDSEVDLAGE